LLNAGLALRGGFWCPHTCFFTLFCFGLTVRLKRREVSLGAFFRYKVGGAAETEACVFVPNKTSFHTVLVLVLSHKCEALLSAEPRNFFSLWFELLFWFGAWIGSRLRPKKTILYTFIHFCTLLYNIIHFKAGLDSPKIKGE
jgi:hypothetical protein